MKHIELTKGYRTIVDDEDYHKLTAMGSWHYSHGRAVRKDSNGTTWMHKVLLVTDLDVDHINGDPLDNRKSNLRPATRSQNNANKGLQSNNTSGYKGVSKFKLTGRFQAYIKKQNKRIHLGYFPTPEQAATAYNSAAKELFGEFAKLNEVKT